MANSIYEKIKGHANPPYNVPWRRLEDKYCTLTMWSGHSYSSLDHAKDRCYENHKEGCESVYQRDGCKGKYFLCKRGNVRDPHVGTDHPITRKDIGCIYTKGCAIFEEGCKNKHITYATKIVDWKQCGAICDKYFYNNKQCNHWRYHTPTKICYMYDKCEPKTTDIRDIRGPKACFSDDPSALKWCCDKIHKHPTFKPPVLWGSFTDPTERKEWEDKQCFSVIGKNSWSKCYHLSWCCKQLHTYPDMIPTVSWGSFPLKNSTKKHKWNLYDCDTLVGGKEKDQCAAKQLLTEKYHMGAYEWRDFYESDGPELFENWKEKYPQGPHFAEGYCRNVENARLSMVCEKDFHDVKKAFNTYVKGGAMLKDIYRNIYNFGYATFKEEEAKFDLKYDGLLCKDNSGSGNLVVLCAGQTLQDGANKSAVPGWNQLLANLAIMFKVVSDFESEHETYAGVNDAYNIWCRNPFKVNCAGKRGDHTCTASLD